MGQFALEERTEFAVVAALLLEIYSEWNFSAVQTLSDWVEVEFVLLILGLKKFLPEAVCMSELAFLPEFLGLELGHELEFSYLVQAESEQILDLVVQIGCLD